MTRKVTKGAPREMPRYKCHKEVQALKIGEGITVNPDNTVTLPITTEGFEPVTVHPKVVQRYMPMPGDYLVTYDDGYQSISPGKAFEDGYTLIR